MDGNRMTTPPSKVQNEARFYRFGRIFFNMAITCLILGALASLSVFISPLLYMCALLVLVLVIILVAIVCAICTFGLVFLTPDNPVAYLAEFTGNFATKGGDSIYSVVTFCINAANCLSVIGMLASALAIVFIALGKGRGKVGKIVFLSVTIAVLGGILAFQLITGGVQWQG